MIHERTSPRTRRLSLIVWTLVLAPSALEAKDPELPADVAKALRENAGELSPLTISYTQQYVSTIDPGEALKRLNMGKLPAAHFFHKATKQVAWRDGRLYCRWETLADDRSGKVLTVNESSFDGKIQYYGSRRPVGPILYKRFLSKLLKEEPGALYLDQRYFAAAGFHLPGPAEDWERPIAESELLYRIDSGGRIESVGEVTESGKTLLRVAVVAPNPAKHLAGEVDLKEMEANLASSRETPERQKEILEMIRRQRKAPETRRFIYWLDPSLHYAVRRWEQWYAPDTLLLLGECDRFAQVAGRRVRLPERCAIHYHEFESVPGTTFKEAFLSEVFEVSALDSGPVPDHRFVLAYQEPGSYIRDATLPEAGKLLEGYVSYTIPASLRDLDEVISRARKGEKFSPAIPPRASSRFTWSFVAFNVVVFLVLGVFVVWLRGRRERLGS